MNYRPIYIYIYKQNKQIYNYIHTYTCTHAYNHAHKYGHIDSPRNAWILMHPCTSKYPGYIRNSENLKPFRVASRPPIKIMMRDLFCKLKVAFFKLSLTKTSHVLEWLEVHNKWQVQEVFQHFSQYPQVIRQ